MKRKINENRKENKNFKYSILKTYKEFDNILMSDEIKSIKIISYDIMRSIANLEYLEGTDLNKHSTEDKLNMKMKSKIMKIQLKEMMIIKKLSNI